MVNSNVVTPRIEIITGPMFCGKTEELIRRTERYKIAGYSVQAFKPSIDDRYDLEEIVSHSGAKLKATLVDGSLNDVLKKLNEDAEVYVFDEIQFFHGEILDLFKSRNYFEDKIMVASGLNQDFTGSPFYFKDSDDYHMGDLIAIADEVIHLNSICTYEEFGKRCGLSATKTQRLVNGEPASINDELIVVGGKDTYEARCAKHHYVKDD